MQKLGFRFGTAGALAPFALFLTGVIWLGLAGAPDERGFWPVLLAALALGLLLARERRDYADAAIAGAARPIVLLMIFAWVLAGVMAELMNASGFVETLIGTASAAGVSGGMFVAAAFLICCAVSTATGTSLGTILLCAPLLYPAAVELAADPKMLIGAILAGATFGDNISPVSDTTIASATTQGAEMGAVVRSRLRYALPAAALALIAFLVFGAGETPAASGAGVASSGVDPAGWLLLAAPLWVVTLLLRGRHLIEGLFAGIVATILLGLATDRLQARELMYLDLEQFGARGLIIDGVERAVGVSIFTILLMALVAGLEASGLLERWMTTAGRRVRSARGAEYAIFGLTSACVLLTTHAVVAILTVGGITRRLGERFDVGTNRRANLLDLTVSTYPFLLPWFIPTVLAAGMTAQAVGAPRLGATQVGLFNFHSWALLIIALIAITTGWGRGGDSSSSAN
jgi:Na+/H+ antiporter NhaC